MYILYHPSNKLVHLCDIYVLELTIFIACRTGRCDLIDLAGNSDALWYAQQIKELGIQFTGFCCGNTASLTRTLAMELGREPPAAR